jgi:hypothetical protein
MSLLDYVCAIAQCNVAAIIREDDSSIFKAFCSAVLVIPVAEYTYIPLTTYDQQYSGSMKEFLNRFIGHTLSRANTTQSFKDQHCLTLGYRTRKFESDPGMRSNAGLECYFVNTIHPFVTSPQWQLLLTRVGMFIYYSI